MIDLRAPDDVLGLYSHHDYSLESLLRSRLAMAGPRACVVFRGCNYSYIEVELLVRRAAAMYAARGVTEGDRVGVMSKSHITTIVTFLALARLGAIMCPFNAEFREQEAGYIIKHSELSGILCSPECIDVIRAAAEQVGRNPWILLNESSEFVKQGEMTWDDAISAAPSEVRPSVGTAESTCVFIYTSGTTGLPKAVMHSQRSVILSAECFVWRMHLQPDDKALCILPLFHINGLFYSVCGSIAAGGTAILAEGFSASTFWKTVAETGATEVNFIAAISRILAKRPRTEFVSGHRLNRILVAPLPEEIEQVFIHEFGVPHLLDGYGMSEIGSACVMPLRGERRKGSVGRLCRHPNPEIDPTELRIVDDEGNDVPDGQTGEFLVRTPTVMQGYFRDPEQTSAAFRHGGWFVTGDLGYRDSEGFVWFVARKKDIIRKRGENISGAELDNVIGSHPAVLEAASIAVPAALGEDEILVAIVMRPGHAVTVSEIVQWCATRLARIKVPKYVVFVDDLPHTPSHRVEKHKLKGDLSLLARATDTEKL